jgi:hypothetical protein
MTSIYDTPIDATSAASLFDAFTEACRNMEFRLMATVVAISRPFSVTHFTEASPARTGLSRWS